MNVIHQKLVVKEWPLKSAGDAKFFGYLVAMGIFPREWCEGGLMPYVDFAHHDDYVRYRLPEDGDLIKRLAAVLWGNVADGGEVASLMRQVWIKRNGDGHDVELP